MNVQLHFVFSLLNTDLNWRRDNAPFFEPTSLGAGVFFTLAHAILNNERLRLKELYTALPHAQSAIRKSIRGLEVAGLVEVVSLETDSRARLIVPTESFKRLVERYLATVLSAMPKDCRENCVYSRITPIFESDFCSN